MLYSATHGVPKTELNNTVGPLLFDTVADCWGTNSSGLLKQQRTSKTQ